jgi:steroid delta-isomerase
MRWGADVAPTPDGLRAAVERYVATINGRDPQAIGALFTEDAVQADPASQPPNVGRAAIIAFFRDGIAASEDWTFEATAVHTCASPVAIDFAIAVQVGGGTMRINGIEVFVAADDGRFASAHAYWDDADVAFA